MIEQFALRGVRIAAFAAVAAGLGACTTVLLPPNITPVVTPSTSVDEANRRLEEVRVQRDATQAEYAAREAVCYTRFFVNNCLDEAREKRRSTLANLRAIEVEAEYFKRKAAVDQRDRDVEQAVKQFEAGEAAAAATPPPEPKVPAVRKPVAPKASLAERRAAQEARLARHAAQEQAAAPKRAAKARQFEERRLESLERQREVEKKKAEKAAKAAEPAK